MFAIILAGGKGERLRPLTGDRPKSMVPLLDKPILEYQIDWLRANGVTDFVLACGYLHETIEQYFQDGGRWGVRIRYSVEREPLGRVRRALRGEERRRRGPRRSAGVPALIRHRRRAADVDRH